jgi:hypothetical protein
LVVAREELSLREILDGFAANAGYLYVALRCWQCSTFNRHGTPASVI